MKGVSVMKFSELDTAVQESIIDLLNNHIASSANILKQDRCLIPMLMYKRLIAQIETFAIIPNRTLNGIQKFHHLVVILMGFIIKHHQF